VETLGIGLLLLAIGGLIILSRDAILLLIFLELGVLGIFLLFANLSFLLEDGGSQGYILAILGLGAIDSVVGIILVLTLFERGNEIDCI
jgi:NADH:ubiquinone oxidoreductase subunit K